MERNEKIKNPMVSVIIPVHNGAKTLRQAFDSVLRQDYKNFELIAVDNNSTDGTKEIIESYQKQNSGIKYLFEPKIGGGAARYKGEINARGEIILMTDSDCIVPQNWIEEIIEPILNNNRAAVHGIKKSAVLNYWTKQIQEEEERLIKIRINSNRVGLFNGANFAIKTSVLQEIGYTNPTIDSGYDIELFVRLKIKGYDIHFKPVPVLHYHPDTALKVFKKVFKRAMWNERIRKMYKTRKELFQITTPIEHLRCILRIVLELMTLHKNFRYDLVTGLAWRIGIAYGRVTIK